MKGSGMHMKTPLMQNARLGNLMLSLCSIRAWKAVVRTRTPRFGLNGFSLVYANMWPRGTTLWHWTIPRAFEPARLQMQPVISRLMGSLDVTNCWSPDSTRPSVIGLS